MRTQRHRWMLAAAAYVVVCCAASARAQITITVVNASFEDTSGQTVFDEFTFGTPAGWTLYDPDTIFPNANIFPGTLQPNGVDFFNTTAPDGDRVAILYARASEEGIGAYGFEQTLSPADVLLANSLYTLEVEVGNIASGSDSNGTPYNLDDFPGYRVQLLAGGTVIAQNDDFLSIAEGEFATETVTLNVGASHLQLGQTLGVRLVNLNTIASSGPDVEVDFDYVRLTVTPVPEPSTWAMLMIAGCAALAFRRARLRSRRSE